jgi:uncharacterized phiE125 gp8 family phage protein
MSWKVTEQPAVEPISLTDAKAFMRVQHDAEDDLITGIIASARDYCEEELDLAIMDQEITLKLDAWPDGRAIYLPRCNLLSVTSVSYLDGNNVSQAFTDFTEDTFGGRLANNTDDWPGLSERANAVTIVYRAGFAEFDTGGAFVPQAVLHAMKMLIAHFYDNRTAVTIGSNNVSQEVAIATSACLQKYRRLGL